MTDAYRCCEYAQMHKNFESARSPQRPGWQTSPTAPTVVKMYWKFSLSAWIWRGSTSWDGHRRCVVQTA